MQNIRDIQEKELLMISDIDGIFKKHGIHYWFLGGSVLGCIRHGGFIPWDDDIDIGVMRDDFSKAESLLSSLKNYTYEPIEHHIVPSAPIGKLHYLDAIYTIHNSPVIDVFVLDGIPESKRMEKIQRLFAQIYHLCIYRKYAKNRGIFNRILTFVILTIIPGRILDHLQRTALNAIIRLSHAAPKKTGNLYGEYGRRENFDTAMFSGVKTGIFENMTVPLPADPEVYLTQLYGNYMELPPVEERIPKHLGVK